MDEQIKTRLDAANKLIFVKQYRTASKALEELAADPAARTELVIHLRRIELSSKLNRVQDLQREYSSEAQAGNLNAQICLALVEQNAELIPAAESIARFQELLKTHGPKAAIYYGLALSLESSGNVDRAIFNYEQSIAADKNWYPAYFGLSQLYYQKGEEGKGDHFFFIFEENAPYNVYGNFETHRKLCNEFMIAEKFAEAEAAISALSEWWMENKGTCPPEVRIYEYLMLTKIAHQKGDTRRAESCHAHVRALAQQALEDNQTSEGVLYFIAKILDEQGENTLALQYYKKLLRIAGGNPSMVQKIGSQFLSLGEYQTAQTLFSEAYQDHPDNPEIRF